MSKHTDAAQVIRDNPDIHYNCTQAILMAYADDLGLTREQAEKIGANLGAGMKMGAVCGAVTGALIVMGISGVNSPDDLQKLYKDVKDNHGGFLECRDLLKRSVEQGLTRKEHCDAIIRQCITKAEELIANKAI